MTGNGEYLVAGYIVIWLVHVFYVWTLGSRTKALREELERLEQRTKGQ